MTVTPPRSPAPPATLFLEKPDTLVMAGDVDADVVCSFAWADRLAQVAVVDLSAATYLDPAARALLLRCLQQVQRQHPGRRLQVRGARRPVREALEVMGICEFGDLVHLQP